MRGYAEVEQVVNGWGIQMRATRLRNMILLVYGILHSRSGSLSAIVRHLPMGARRHTHRLKRLHRFLKNPGVQVERCFPVLAAVIWRDRPRGERTSLCPVILDWTQVHDLHVLFAAVQAGAECFACKVDPDEGLLLLMYGLMFKIKAYCTVIVDMLR